MDPRIMDCDDDDPLSVDPGPEERKRRIREQESWLRTLIPEKKMTPDHARTILDWNDRNSTVTITIDCDEPERLARALDNSTIREVIGDVVAQMED